MSIVGCSVDSSSDRRTKIRGLWIDARAVKHMISEVFSCEGVRGLSPESGVRVGSHGGGDAMLKVWWKHVGGPISDIVFDTNGGYSRTRTVT